MSSIPVDSPNLKRCRFGLTEAFVAATLVLLLCHAWEYRFLTDDAFISFRYARNLSQGFGLVFNPGFERVEGYSNFLWVLILALGNVLGIRPESAANPLSLAATIALWCLVVWFVYRNPPVRGRRWLLIIAPLFLALTRSVAVWSTSGLETRLFEVLVVAGALRLIVEVEAQLAGRPRRGLAGLLFALATWTRPDGMLISGMALGSAGLYLLVRRRLAWRRFVAWNAGVYVLLVGGHIAFRLAYYGYWVPNTYYAKVSGETWWDMGLVYLGAFTLEYAAYLWIPLLVAGVWARCRSGTGYVPLLYGAIVLPHLLYVAAIGGDHFEYRPLDLYFPFAFLLIYDGACILARGVRAAWAVGVYLLVALIGLTALGWQSHRQFPSYYIPGFPGQMHHDWEAASAFLAPEHSPIYRCPGLDALARLHQKFVRKTTKQFVGNRQEEHRLFCELAVARGFEHKRFADTGIFPHDVHLVLSAVGAVPYYTDFRVLDFLGLTDVHVAHGPRRQGQRFMAHDRSADEDYIRESGADFQSWLGETCVIHGDDPQLIDVLLKCLYRWQGQVPYAAEIDGGDYLVGYLPQGLQAAARRFPDLQCQPLADRANVNSLLQKAVERYRHMDEVGQADFRIRSAWAIALINLGQDYDEAVRLLRIIVAERPNDAGAWTNLSIAAIACGQREESRAAAERGLALARAQGESEWVSRMRQRIEECWWKLGERLTVP